MDTGEVMKVRSGYQRDMGIFMTLVWDEFGKYKGQWQVNVIDDRPDAPDELWLPAKGDENIDLTEEQMKGATPQLYTS